MCPTKIEPKIEPIELDLSAAFSLEHGFGRSMLLEVGPQLDAARHSLLSAIAEGSDYTLSRPQSLLDEYKTSRRDSLLGRILSSAKRLREMMDRAVILGPPRLVETTKALFHACCHPYHNDLSRGQRGGRPRIHFAPAVPDNDAIQSLLETLPHGRVLHAIDEGWGLVVVEEGGSERDGDALLVGLFSLFWDVLQSTTTPSQETERTAVVGPPNSSLVNLAEQIGIACIPIENKLPIAYRLPPAYSAFHPGVLLAASVMGMDIVKLLRGAAMMSHRLSAMPPGNNPPLDLAGLCNLLARRRGINDRHIVSPHSALACLAQNLQTASRGDHLLIQWIADDVRHDRLQIAMPAGETAAGRPRKAERFLADIAAEQADTVRQERLASGLLTAVIHLPIVDEGTVGQLLQLFSLAETVEEMLGRTIGV